MTAKQTRTVTKAEANTRTKIRKTIKSPAETDGQYLLKLVVVLILGTLWLKFASPISLAGLPIAGIPVGMIFGLLVVSRAEKLQDDRKIWYAILLVITVISYFVPAGIVI